MGIVDEGLTPYVYTQGDYTSRLEIIKDVPKGKVAYHVRRTFSRQRKS